MLLGQRWGNVVNFVGPTLGAQRWPTVWLYCGPLWAQHARPTLGQYCLSHNYGIGPSFGQHCHFRWANVGNTTLAHCLTALWAFIGPTGRLYGRVIIWPTLHRSDNMSLLEIQLWFNIAWPSKLAKKIYVNTYFGIYITFHRLIYMYIDLLVSIHYN